jgi:hypothetical protein
MSQFTKFGKIFGWIFITAGAAAVLLYFGLRALSGRSPITVFVLFAHFTPYQDFYPIPYLLAITLIFAVVGALWLTFIMPRFTRLRFGQIMLLPWIALLLAGPVWGMLWAYHDMQAGFFPPFPQMVDYLWYGVRKGIYIALSSAWYSAPFNLLAYSVACLLVALGVKRFGSESRG